MLIFQVSLIFFKNTLNWAQGCALVITAQGRWKHKEQEFKVSLGCVKRVSKNPHDSANSASESNHNAVHCPWSASATHASSAFVWTVFLCVFYDFFFSRISYFLTRFLWESLMLYSSRGTISGLIIFFSPSTRDWTQGLTHGRQALYPWGLVNPLCFIFLI